MGPGDLSLDDPETGTHDPSAVTRGFWAKVRRTAGKVPFLPDAVAAYYCATDAATPFHVKAVLLAALAYFVVPTDVIPDFIAGLGYSDDASVLYAAIATVRRHISDHHRRRASALLDATADRQAASGESASPAP